MTVSLGTFQLPVRFKLDPDDLKQAQQLLNYAYMGKAGFEFCEPVALDLECAHWEVARGYGAMIDVDLMSDGTLRVAPPAPAEPIVDAGDVPTLRRMLNDCEDYRAQAIIYKLLDAAEGRS